MLRMGGGGEGTPKDKRKLKGGTCQARRGSSRSASLPSGAQLPRAGCAHGPQGPRSADTDKKPTGQPRAPRQASPRRAPPAPPPPQPRPAVLAQTEALLWLSQPSPSWLPATRSVYFHIQLGTTHNAFVKMKCKKRVTVNVILTNTL